MTRYRLATKILVASLVVLASVASSASAQDAEPSELTVTEIQLATSLERGQAVSPTTSFSRADGRIYAVVRLANPSGEETSVRVSIEPLDGPPRDGISLSVPAQRRYRTVARMSTSRPAGRYRCVVRTEDGRELSSVELTVEE